MSRLPSWHSGLFRRRVQQESRWTIEQSGHARDFAPNCREPLVTLRCCLGACSLQFLRANEFGSLTAWYFRGTVRVGDMRPNPNRVCSGASAASCAAPATQADCQNDLSLVRLLRAQALISDDSRTLGPCSRRVSHGCSGSYGPARHAHPGVSSIARLAAANHRGYYRLRRPVPTHSRIFVKVSATYAERHSGRSRCCAKAAWLCWKLACADSDARRSSGPAPRGWARERSPPCPRWRRSTAA